MMKWIDKPENQIPYFTFENLERAGFVNAFTTRFCRQNPVTNGLFKPLMRAESDPGEISYCTELLLSQFGSDPEHLVPSAQKHTANIHVVTEKDLGPVGNRPVLESIDGLVTDIPGVMLQTFGADCPSIYLADPVHRVIGLCHSGRNGTQRHIGAVMLKTMVHEFKTDPGDTLAAVSPGICTSCYEVGDDVALDFVIDYLSEVSAESKPEDYEKLLNKGLEKGVLQFMNGRYHIDIFRAVMLSLTRAGIPEENIEISDVCTKCKSDLLYSFRAEGRISNENCAILMI